MTDQDKTREQLLEELAQLRQQVAQQRRIDETIPLLIATAGFDGCFRELNPAFERLLGWPEEESVSQPFLEFIHPEDRASATEHFERLTFGKNYDTFMARMMCRDGSCRWISWVAISFADRDMVHGIGKDITDQMETMISCRKVEEHYRQIADATPDIIYVLNESGSLTYANREAGKVFGVNPELLIGTNHLDLFPPEKNQIHLKHILEAFETGQTGNLKGLYRFGGRKVWLDIRIIPLRNKEGRIVSLMVVCRDVTEEKQAEQPQNETATT